MASGVADAVHGDPSASGRCTGIGLVDICSSVGAQHGLEVGREACALAAAAHVMAALSADEYGPLVLGVANRSERCPVRYRVCRRLVPKVGEELAESFGAVGVEVRRSRDRSGTPVQHDRNPVVRTALVRRYHGEHPGQSCVQLHHGREPFEQAAREHRLRPGQRRFHQCHGIGGDCGAAGIGADGSRVRRASRCVFGGGQQRQHVGLERRHRWRAGRRRCERRCVGYRCHRASIGISARPGRGRFGSCRGGCGG